MECKSRYHIQQKRDAGFTLVEILIAIVILSLLMLSIYNIVDNSTRQKDYVQREDRQLLQVETALNRFSIDFSQIYNPLFFSGKPQKAKKTGNDDYQQKGFVPTDRFSGLTIKGYPIPVVDDPDKNSIIFMTSSNKRKIQDSKQSNYAWVHYTTRSAELDADELDKERLSKGGLEFIRYFIPQNPYETEFEWDKHKPQLLLRFVKKLEFEYWDSKKKKYISSLRYLPSKDTVRAVKIKLTWIDANNLEQELEETFRTIWPYFDTKLDEIEEKKDKKIDETKKE